jgi:hypothetical protein
MLRAHYRYNSAINENNDIHVEFSWQNDLNNMLYGGEVALF